MEKPSIFELYQTDSRGLRRIASELNIPIPDDASRFDIIDLVRLFPSGLSEVANGSLLQAQSETAPEIQKYSVRIQRIRDTNK